VAITEADLHAYAARVRPYVPSELRDTAEELAFAIAQWVGSQVKLLRPETTLEEIVGWMKAADEHAQDSLSDVEAFMCLEEEFGCNFPDDLVSQPSSTTFLQLVRYAQTKKRAV
jgi:acyl carrier protein